MKFFLILVVLAADGFVPRGQAYDTRDECEAALAQIRAEAQAFPEARYAAACLRVRSGSEKEV